MEAMLIVLAIGYTIMVAILIRERGKKFKGNEGVVPMPNNDDSIIINPNRKIGDKCYMMMHNEIVCVHICGIRIKYSKYRDIRRYLIANRTEDCDIKSRCNITYELDIINEVYPSQLYSSKEELIDSLLNNEQRQQIYKDDPYIKMEEVEVI